MPKTCCLSIVALAAALLQLREGVCADPPTPKQLQRDYREQIMPFLTKYCTQCHGMEAPEAELNLDRGSALPDFEAERGAWQRVAEMLRRREMPPEEEAQPAPDEAAKVVRWLESRLHQFDCSRAKYPGRVTIRRLNRVEYNNTIRDLVGVDFRPADDFPSDDVGNGFDNIGDVLSLPPILMEKYVDAAEQVIEKAFEDDALRKRIVICEPSEQLDATQCAKRILTAFAGRAFRRPASEREIQRLLALRRAALQAGESDVEALKLTLQAVLASPYFLFRVELDPDPSKPNAIRVLNDYELATRLSYFLWSSMPDDELFQLAKQGKLQQPEVLQQQVRRMLQDARSEALVKNFAGQWLQLRDLDSLTPDPELFPQFDSELRRAMRRETELFVANLIREDRSVLEFLNADYTFVNPRLARHYGLKDVRGEGFRRVSLEGKQRRGVLTHASILLITSNPTRTSPVKRGKWILENMLDQPPPPPPAGVQELEEQADLIGSLRERMQQHRSNEACAVCHRSMDMLGFGMENFDAIGGWRDRDGEYEIDASGTLPGGYAFRGPGELMAVLKQHKTEDFCRCLIRKMLVYGLGRGLRPYDQCAEDEILKKLKQGDYRFTRLVLAIVQSDPFRMRGSTGELE